MPPSLSAGFHSKMETTGDTCWKGSGCTTTWPSWDTLLLTQTLSKTGQWQGKTQTLVILCFTKHMTWPSWDILLLNQTLSKTGE